MSIFMVTVSVCPSSESTLANKSLLSSTKSEGYSFGVVRQSIPSVRPHFLSVRNHISVPIGQI